MVFYFNKIGMIALTVSFLLLAGCDKKQEEKPKDVVRPVKIMHIKGSGSDSFFTFPGTIRAAKRAILSFKVSGPLVALPVEEGQHLKKGDLIAQIQKRDFLTAVEEARARSREARQQFKRYKELYAKRQVSRADFDRYRSAMEVANAQLEDAVNALKDTTLVAPFDGVIAKRYVENFQKVKAKEPIVNLQDISRIEVLVDVPELVMAAIKNRGTGQVVVRFDSIPGKVFPVTLKEYSTEADPATQTYQVVFMMDQPAEANILPGMTASVTATSRSASNGNEKRGAAITIPAIAVLDAPGDHPYVWVFDAAAGVVHKREIRIGSLEGSEEIQVLQGLSPGEIIVVAGVTKLREGMKVRPWEKQREGR